MEGIKEQELLEQKINEIMLQKLQGKNYSIEQKLKLYQEISDSLQSRTTFERLIQDDTITEIIVNGPDSVFVKKNGQLLKIDDVFDNQMKFEDTIQRFISHTREVNEANPFFETRLQDGSVVEIVLPPISKNGPCMTIRKTGTGHFEISGKSVDILEELVRTRRNVFICGAADTGKTALLNRMLKMIPQNERVITIEKTAELQTECLNNLVSLEGFGFEAIDEQRMLRAALSMLPERIVIGEVCGREAFDMLYAMNAGRATFLAAISANSIEDMLVQLECMIAQEKHFMQAEVLQKQIASALDIIIRVAKIHDGSQRIVEIAEVLPYKKGEIRWNPLYILEEDKEYVK